MPYQTIDGLIVEATADFDNPYAPVDIVVARFNDTLGKAEEVYTMLVGESGSGGLLGDMQAAIASAPSVTIEVPPVDTSLTLETSGQTLPVFDDDTLQTFPTDTYAEPVLDVIPTIDSDFEDVSEPADITVALSWSESSLPTTVYNAIWTRLSNDLASGATGLDPTVEQAIYDRARTRQQADSLAEYNRINNIATELQHALPSGVLLSALTDFGISANRQAADIENQIIITQADLAQKNSQFSIQQAVAIEQLVRNTRDNESNRALDAAKVLSTLTVQDFQNRVQRYATIWEGRKVKVQAQAESLRGVIDSNRGKVDIFKTLYDALRTRIEAVTSYNKGLTDVHLGKVQGFGEVERAVAAKNESAIKLIEEQIKAADLQLRGLVAQYEGDISAYTAEGSLKERFSKDIAEIASQVVSSMLAAVHAGANLGYSGSEGSSKTFHMGVSLDENHSYNHSGQPQL